MKYYGNVGYVTTEEVRPSVYKPVVKELPYYGEVTSLSRRIDASGKVNDDVTISNSISIVSDPYALQNFHAIRYVVWQGVKWKVSNVTVNYPRLNLTLGGVYNGDTGSST